MAKDRLVFRNLYGLACIVMLLGLNARLSGAKALAFALIFLAAILVLERAVFWRLWAASKYRNNPSLREQIEFKIDDSNLMRTSSAGNQEIRWANILACHETKNLFLLRIVPNELLTVPKRAFSPADLYHFRELRQKELIVKTTQRNPDALLLKFVVTWGLMALVLMAMFIGKVDNFLSQIPGARQRPSTYSFKNRTKAKPLPASSAELRGRGTVYMAAVGPVKSVSLPQLVEGFRKHYGLEIHLLPQVSVPSWAWNTIRKQPAAEDLVTALKLSYPKLAADPTATVIGITDEDMYIQALKWTYAFSFRNEERFAVISTSHLRLTNDDEEQVTPEALQKRTLKVLIRDVGFLHYRLQPSSDYSSILYEYLNDGDELDDVGEDYLESDAEVRADLHVENGDPCFILRHYADPARDHAETGTVSNCSGYYKELNLETVQIDLRYGLLLDQRTDFLTTDKLPLELTRVLRTQDSRSRAFGIGGTHNLNVFLVGDKWPFTWMDLVLEHGGRSHFRRSNWGFGYWDVRYSNRDTNRSEFSGSNIEWAWPGWRLERAGTTYLFPDGNGAGRPEQTALSSIRSYNQSQITLHRDGAGNLMLAHSSFGSELAFQYDSAYRVIEIDQKGGGQVRYSYDTSGHLIRVTDANQRVVEYGYDPQGRLNRVAQDGKTICSLQYDEADRVTSETLADGTTYNFHYVARKDRVAFVDIFDSAGPRRRLQLFDSTYTLDVRAKGE
jgi:YD repeat-containing protein